MEKIIEFIHSNINRKINNNSICVDMTIGNGHDTLFMASKAKFTYGFDIQELAINNTTKLLEDNNITNYKLILDSHSNIDKYINDMVDIFAYNLGYLPTGNKNITTMVESTINSLIKALDLLNEKGMIVLAVYEGHDEGKKESNALYDFVTKLDQKEYDVVIYRFVNQINNPPYAIIIEKRY